jgi:hypothetical protein
MLFEALKSLVHSSGHLMLLPHFAAGNAGVWRGSEGIWGRGPSFLRRCGLRSTLGAEGSSTVTSGLIIRPQAKASIAVMAPVRKG